MVEINQILSASVVSGSQAERVKTNTEKIKGDSFEDVLKKQIEKKTGSLKFSKHAVERMETRHINFTTEQIEKAERTINKIAAKGARESLLVIDGVAMVVSVDNRTVITCVGQEDMKDNIFTNIDSVVLL